MLATMGSLAESMIRQSVSLLTNPTGISRDQLLKDEDEVNRLHMAIDDSCLRMLVLRQPVAVDLRFLASTIKMNGELERIGDLSINLMKRARKLEEQTAEPVPIDLNPLITVAIGMVNDALDAFSRRDVGLARKVLESEKAADEQRHQLEDSLAEMAERQGKNFMTYLQMTLVVYHLERIADHATNIAEDVVYMVEGTIIRHKAEIYRRR